MKYTNSKFYYCLLAVLAGMPGMSDAAPVIRVGNQARSYSQAYNQVNTQRAGTNGDTTANGASTSAAVAAASLPVRVADENLASKIIANDPNIPVTIDTLQQCALIYPDAKFEWTKPNLGVNAGAPATCSAVVELYAFGAGQNGENIVVARGNLAAGDAFKCNISEFPAESWLPMAGTVTFPADAEPTEEEVKAIMNEEQKQGAGFKIAAGVVLAGLAGNAMGKNEPGKDTMFGGGKDKILSTVAAAAGGGALMAASSYGGKVAGDMIASAGVNAAMGAIVGNVAATGKNDVLRIENCEFDGKTERCLYGHVLSTGAQINGSAKVFVSITDPDNFVVCENTTTGDKKECNSTQYKDMSASECYWNCTRKQLKVGSDFTIKGDGMNLYTSKVSSSKTPKSATLDDMAQDNFAKIDDHYLYTDNEMIKCDGPCDSETIGSSFVMISGDIREITAKQRAVIVRFNDKLLGIKKSDWDKVKGDSVGGEIYLRGLGGSLLHCGQGNNCTIDAFEPETLSASDGGIIDMDNKARLGTTLTGAGAGAALGAFSANQGAKTEIQERWVAAVREYKDTLQKFYCMSGNRFLSFYNDVVIVPQMTPIEQQ
ncbi:MAG: hypothetical protein J6R22_01515 [Alphaproteobacteria bacterium]|nr:hypothetical protein [Alphaproteobacteria bacterium]